MPHAVEEFALPRTTGYNGQFTTIRLPQSILPKHQPEAAGLLHPAVTAYALFVKNRADVFVEAYPLLFLTSKEKSN
jgi:hypothetical protein